MNMYTQQRGLPGSILHSTPFIFTVTLHWKSPACSPSFVFLQLSAEEYEQSNLLLNYSDWSRPYPEKYKKRNKRKETEKQKQNTTQLKKKIYCAY